MPKKTIENIAITGLGYGGVGIGVLPDGKKVLVKGGLPGSVVDGRVIKRKKDYAEVQITAVKSYDGSLQSLEQLCPHYLFAYGHAPASSPHTHGCGGCKRQILGYDKQLDLKQLMVADSLRKIPACQTISLPAVLPSPDTLQYRNKIEFSCGNFRLFHDESGKSTERNGLFDEYTTIGFHQQGRFAQIIDVDHCLLVTPRMHEVYTVIKASLLASGLPFYRLSTHEGLLRHIVLRAGHHTGQCMLLLSIASRRFVDHPDDETIWTELLTTRAQDPHVCDLVTTCVVVSNNGLADIVNHHEAEVTTVWGDGRIFEELHLFDQTLTFQISPFSFFQTNTLGAEVLFSTALQMVGKVQGTVLDLYCGSGTIGICALKAGRGSELVGIEIVDEAIRDAQKNAQINGVADRTHFFAGKVEHLVKHHTQLADLLTNLELIIVDPPREGLHKTVIEFLLTIQTTHKPKLLYISCNPVTFARDIQLLTQGGRTLNALQPVDMFPQTYHVEMIGVLR